MIGSYNQRHISISCNESEVENCLSNVLLGWAEKTNGDMQTSISVVFAVGDVISKNTCR